MLAWEQFLSQLEKELGSQIVREWLRPLKVARFDAANLFLEAENSFQASWFEEHIRHRLKERFLNNNHRPIRVHLSLPSPQKEAPQKESPTRFSISPDHLDPEMTLDHFIPSPTNLMAYKLLSEIKETSPFNPIYLFGEKGSGKTHLLMGAAAALKAQGKRVFFVRAETFTEHVVQAIRLGFMQDFRKTYRDIDVLIVDDVHIFSRKSSTQEEFFHTFNTLHTLGRLILLSANVPPQLLKEIEPRLVSRFEWGLSTRIEKGEKKAILQKKAALWKLPLNAALLQLLLEKFSRDPLLALQALAIRHSGKTPLTPEAAERLIPDLLAQEQKNILTPEKIIKSTAAHYGIRAEDLLGKSQMREYAHPRQIAMYLCREHLKWPFQKIGQFFERDHSTVMSSAKQIQKGIEEKKGEIVEAISVIASHLND